MTPYIRLHRALFIDWVGGMKPDALAKAYEVPVGDVEVMLRRYGWMLRQPLPEVALLKILTKAKESRHSEATLRAALYCYEHEIDWPPWLEEAMKKAPGLEGL